MKRYQEFKELNLSNYFLFPAVMEDHELCRDMLEICIGESISRIRVHTEENRQYHPQKRALRLDVKAWNTQAKYNAEMQNARKQQLPKRGRYHQSMEDVLSLGSGRELMELCENYVIFICTFDPFYSRKYRYIYENLSREEKLYLGDGTHKIYLNTKGTNEHEVPRELVHFLKYVEDSTDRCAQYYKDDLFIQRLHQRVLAVKEDRDKEEEYMLFGELLDEREELGEKRGEERGIEFGEKRGEKRGSDKIVRLVRKMMEDGCCEEIRQLDEPEFLQEMLQKYGIK